MMTVQNAEDTCLADALFSTREAHERVQKLLVWVREASERAREMQEEVRRLQEEARMRAESQAESAVEMLARALRMQEHLRPLWAPQ